MNNNNNAPPTSYGSYGYLAEINRRNAALNQAQPLMYPPGAALYGVQMGGQYYPSPVGMPYAMNQQQQQPVGVAPYYAHMYPSAQQMYPQVQPQYMYLQQPLPPPPAPEGPESSSLKKGPSSSSVPSSSSFSNPCVSANPDGAPPQTFVCSLCPTRPSYASLHSLTQHTATHVTCPTCGFVSSKKQFKDHSCLEGSNPSSRSNTALSSSSSSSSSSSTSAPAAASASAEPSSAQRPDAPLPPAYASLAPGFRSVEVDVGESRPKTFEILIGDEPEDIKRWKEERRRKFPRRAAEGDKPAAAGEASAAAAAAAPVAAKTAAAAVAAAAAEGGDIEPAKTQGEGEGAVGTQEAPGQNSSSSEPSKPVAATADVRNVAAKSAASSVAAKGKGAKICRFFQQPAGCRSGDTCPFLHGPSPSSPSPPSPKSPESALSSSPPPSSSDRASVDQPCRQPFLRVVPRPTALESAAKLKYEAAISANPRRLGLGGGKAAEQHHALQQATLLKKLLEEEERRADDLAIRCLMYVADCGFMQGGGEGDKKP